jgi:hypothetical protein
MLRDAESVHRFCQAIAVSLILWGFIIYGGMKAWQWLL